MKSPQNIVMFPVKSSNLKSIGYDAKRRILHIIFNKNSTVRYNFHDVPKHIFDYMKRSQSSLGVYFHTKIKNKYEMTKT